MQNTLWKFEELAVQPRFVKDSCHGYTNIVNTNSRCEDEDIKPKSTSSHPDSTPNYTNCSDIRAVTDGRAEVT